MHAEAIELYGILTGKMHDYLVTVDLFTNEKINCFFKRDVGEKETCNCTK